MSDTPTTNIEVQRLVKLVKREKCYRDTSCCCKSFGLLQHALYYYIYAYTIVCHDDGSIIFEFKVYWPIRLRLIEGLHTCLLSIISSKHILDYVPPLLVRIFYRFAYGHICSLLKCRISMRHLRSKLF